MASTDEEWKKLIAEVAQAVDAANPQPAITSNSLDTKTLAKTIDHTLLKLDATEAQVTEICKEALQYDFAAACVRLNFVAHSVAQLKSNPSIKVACVIGFHEGTQSLASKLSESEEAIKAGATELDVVLKRDQLKAGKLHEVYSELSRIRAVSPKDKIVLKLILETSQLSRDEVIAASVLAGYAGFDFIKTSTGFCGRGASVEDVILMSKIAEVVQSKVGGKKMKVKASGGVREHIADAKKMLDAGAERIGASAGVAIMKEFLGEGAAAGGSGY